MAGLIPTPWTGGPPFPTSLLIPLPPGPPTSLPGFPNGLSVSIPGLPFHWTSTVATSSAQETTITTTTVAPASETQPTTQSTTQSTTLTSLSFSSSSPALLSASLPPGRSFTTSQGLASSVSSSSAASEALTTASVTKATFTTCCPSTSLSTPAQPTGMSSTDISGIGSNRTLVITLSTVLSVVGFLLILGGVLLCWRRRQSRTPFFRRGITPIGDDEIATWKVSREEKERPAPDPEAAGAAVAAAAAAAAAAPVVRYAAPTSTNQQVKHARQLSVSSTKKPPSVIVYPNAYGQGRTSEERSPKHGYNSYAGNGKTSFDKDLPQTPIQARAPNARAGLTDEAVPGDEPFLPSPKRHPSRLSKVPPIPSPKAAHTRVRSSRSSSMRSFGDSYAYAGSEMELSPTRHSHDNYHYSRGHSRVFSSSSIPPRLSFGDDFVIGGLSPRPLNVREDDIGRAIG